MSDFELFKRLARLYFAAASFSETARRLGRTRLAAGLSAVRPPDVSVPDCAPAPDGAMPRLTDGDREALFARIDRAIEPFDIAGLGDDARRDWYPVLAEDLVAARAAARRLPGGDRRVCSSGAASLEHTLSAEPPPDAEHGTRAGLAPLVASLALGALATAAVMTAVRVPARTGDLRRELREAVTAFYTGLAAMQTSQDVLARQALERVTTLVPHEPAGWANIGLLLLRQQEIDAASRAADEGRRARARGRARCSACSAWPRVAAATSRRRSRTGSARCRTRPGRCQGRLRAGAGSRATGQSRHDAEAQRVLEALVGTHRITSSRASTSRGSPPSAADGAAVQRGVTALAGAAAAWPAESRNGCDRCSRPRLRIHAAPGRRSRF